MSFGAKIITTNHQRRKKKDEKMMKKQNNADDKQMNVGSYHSRYANSELVLE